VMVTSQFILSLGLLPSISPTSSTCLLGVYIKLEDVYYFCKLPLTVKLKCISSVYSWGFLLNHSWKFAIINQFPVLLCQLSLDENHSLCYA
jgi:hypothetical protein